MPRNPDEVGALWLKTGSKGDYMTGEINGVKVVCFKNDRKTESKQPDWRVMKSKPRDAAPAERASFSHPTEPTDGIDW
jgi:uncharacterized protein (DUF736 family)